MTGTSVEVARLPPGALADGLAELIDGPERNMKEAIDLLLRQALSYGASDIHVENYRGRLRARLRVDGYFCDVANLPGEAQEQLVSRVKVLAGLIVHRRDLPQEGRIRSAGTDFRVSIIPTVSGEKLAIRIFDSAGGVMELENLGFDPETLARFERHLLTLGGMVLLTGSSGSGKTTTLYAALRRIHDRCGDHAGITTIEDPVEFDLGLFPQMQVNPRAELTFSACLTAVLRQDPQVIMIGEIRDPMTCEIAMRSGLTGHLVLSTIHSGTACGVVTRLLDMGIEPYVVTSALKAVLAQRLVRRVCPECAEPYTPDPGLLATFRRQGAEFEGPFVRGRGCAACLESGYAGRVALAELLTVDEALSTPIIEKVGTARLFAAAVDAGFEPILKDGVRKVKMGYTTPEEVVRVLGPEASR